MIVGNPKKKRRGRRGARRSASGRFVKAAASNPRKRRHHRRRHASNPVPNARRHHRRSSRRRHHYTRNPGLNFLGGGLMDSVAMGVGVVGSDKLLNLLGQHFPQFTTGYFRPLVKYGIGTFGKPLVRRFVPGRLGSSLMDGFVVSAVIDAIKMFVPASLLSDYVDSYGGHFAGRSAGVSEYMGEVPAVAQVYAGRRSIPAFQPYYAAR